MCVFQHVELAGEVSRGRHSVQQRACPLQRKRGGGDRGSRAQRLLAQPQEESCRHQEAVRAAGLGADNSRIYRACREPPRPGTPPTCGVTPASATSPTASAAATYDDPRPRPTPAAPPVRLGPARQGPLTLGPGGGAGGAAFPSRAHAGRVSIACCAPGLAAALGLLVLDAEDSRAPKGSLRKFLEQLSGAGKAIGVLTSGGHAQVFPFRVHPLKNGLVKNSSRVSAPRGATLPTVVSSAVTRRHAQRLAARQMWPRGHRTSLRTDVLMQINEDGDRCRTVSPPGADGSLGIPETPESLLPWVEGNLPWKMGNAIRRKYQGT
ncbi:uncharacterized protein [Macaca fascicularis]|uniref:uncharacterized protein n=1 Tax=Macaca fascicularis TaxID=9541 RepID=UPI003D157D41